LPTPAELAILELAVAALAMLLPLKLLKKLVSVPPSVPELPKAFNWHA
jgi:hypothetical protein